MPQYNFKQSFWLIDAGAGDIGAHKRAQIAKAALTLNDHADVVLSTSAGGYTVAERPEIALVVAIDYDVAALLPAVEKALAAEHLSVKVHLQGDIRYYNFGATELTYIAAATKVEDLHIARTAIDELSAIPLQPISTERPDLADVLKSVTGRAAPIPPSELAEGFSVTYDRFSRLRAARGDAIEQEIMGLSNTFGSLQRETNTNAAAATMVASGLISIGSAMYKAYAAVQSAGSVALLVSNLLAAVGGIAGLAIVIAVVAVLFGFLWVILKDAVNVLLFLNGRSVVTNFTEDFILHGERNTIVQSMEAAVPNPPSKPPAFPCGFYFYHKWRIGRDPGEPRVAEQPAPPRIPIGFYGSCMGITFTSSGQRFSVGMDSPNTILGGTNSIRATGQSATVAANLAADSGTATEAVTVGAVRVTVSRAAALGSVNYGICYLA